MMYPGDVAEKTFQQVELMELILLTDGKTLKSIEKYSKWNF